MKLATLILCGASLVFSLPATAQAPLIPDESWSLDVGLNYVTGDFGFEQDTDVWLQVTTIHFESQPLHIQASIPFVSISGPASVIGTVGRPSTGRERGLGDASFAATYKFTDTATGISDLDFTVRVKFPTADEDKGLGTGETDTNLEFNYHHSFRAFTPFATLGYRFLGSSATYPLEDGFYSTAGIAAPIDDRTVGGLALTWRERIVADADHATEAMIFISHQLDGRWKVQGFALSGFTDASPNFGAGGLVGYKF
ncbi:MAG TPA: hypothetical protein VIK52_11735 [Opitutaceae bacterium]